MEKTYQLTCGEYEHLYWRITKEKKGSQLVATMLLLAAVMFLPIYMHHGCLPAAIMAGVFVLLFALTIGLMIHFSARSAYKSASRSHLWGDVAVRLEPDSLITATRLIKSEIRWEAVTKISEDAKGFYFDLGLMGTVMVPLRVFASDEEARTFGMTAQEFFQHARRTPIRG